VCKSLAALSATVWTQPCVHLEEPHKFVKTKEF
jgi:hypothetical protein